MKKSMLDYIIKVRLPIIVFVIVLAFTTTYFATSKTRLGVGYQPEQPIDYSHQLHAGDLGIDCQYCHIGADKGRKAVVPAVDVCMNCHTYAQKDQPEIKKLAAYFAANEPVPWVRVHKMPDHVYFSHSAHVNAGIDCSNCHGPIEKMVVVEQVKPFSMGDCLACHREPHNSVEKLRGDIIANINELRVGPENCSGCHR
jgi:hypothetical protein